MDAYGATVWDIEKLTKLVGSLAVTLMAFHPEEFDNPVIRELCEEAGVTFHPGLDELLTQMREARGEQAK